MRDDTPDDIHPLFHGAPDTEAFRKLRKRIVQQVREATEALYAELQAAGFEVLLDDLAGVDDALALILSGAADVGEAEQEERGLLQAMLLSIRMTTRRRPCCFADASRAHAGCAIANQGRRRG